MPKAMLAHAIHDVKDVITLVGDNDWAASQKVDGHRLMVSINDPSNKDPVRFLNRQGAAYRAPIHKDLIAFFTTQTDLWGDENWIFDGEYLPDEGVYWVFDLIASPMWDTEGRVPYSRRIETLQRIVALCDDVEARFKCLPVHTRSRDKAALVERVLSEGGEGVMFRKLDSVWTPMRSTNLIKFKATDTADVIVTEVRPDTKNSVAMKVYNTKGQQVPVGSVLVKAAMLNVLKVGDVIEVRYLYRGAGGRLVQPSFIRRRPDKIPSECHESQLRPTNKGVLTQ